MDSDDSALGPRPTTATQRHSPSSAIGEIESIGNFATGLTHLRGRRREVARWLVVALLALPMVLFVIAELVR